jgi:hypothetical protein
MSRIENNNIYNVFGAAPIIADRVMGTLTMLVLSVKYVQK